MRKKRKKREKGGPSKPMREKREKRKKGDRAFWLRATRGIDLSGAPSTEQTDLPGAPGI